MASFTSFLNLLKKNPATDGKDTFNIETMLNENWDKIDLKVKENSSAIGQNTTNLSTHLADLVSDADGVHGLKTEKGIWTPELTAADVTAAVNYTVRDGNFYRVGKMVRCNFFIRCTLTGGSGDVRVMGLPYTPDTPREVGIIAQNTLAGVGLGWSALSNAGGLSFLSAMKNGVAVPVSTINNGTTCDLAGSIVYSIN